MNIGETIKRLMKEQGYTLEMLSDRIGWSTSAIIDWRKGRTAPSSLAMWEMAQVFGVSMDEMFGVGK